MGDVLIQLIVGFWDGNDRFNFFNADNDLAIRIALSDYVLFLKILCLQNVLY